MHSIAQSWDNVERELNNNMIIMILHVLFKKLLYSTTSASVEKVFSRGGLFMLPITMARFKLQGPKAHPVQELPDKEIIKFTH